MKRLLLIFTYFTVPSMTSSLIISCTQHNKTIEKMNLSTTNLVVEKQVIKDSKKITEQEQKKIIDTIQHSFLEQLKKLNKNITSEDFNIININELQKFKHKVNLEQQSLIIQATDQSKYLYGQTKPFNINLLIDLANRNVPEPHLHILNEQDLTSEIDNIKTAVENQIDMFISNINPLSEFGIDYEVENFELIAEAKTSAQLNSIKLRIIASTNSRYLVGQTNVFHIDSHLASAHE